MVTPNEFLRTEMNVLSRGFIPPEDVAHAEREPIAMVRSHITWAGVIAGSILTIALVALSCSFAIACGVPAFSGIGGVGDIGVTGVERTYGLGTGVWSVITSIIAFGAGGWLAACLTSSINARYRVLHGAMAWALAVGILLLGDGGIGVLAGRGMGLLATIREMVVVAPRIAPAWGAFVSLAFGLIAAICGGALPDLFRGDRKVVTTMPATEL